MDRPTGSRPAASSDSHSLPWTATRCHRLLRPLLTHISALRKEVNRRPQTESAMNDSFQSLFATTSNESGPVTDIQRVPARKRVRHTYSLKASERARLDDKPAEDVAADDRTSSARRLKLQEPNAVLATPIVRRLQGQWSSPLVPEPVIPKGGMSAKPGRCYHKHEFCGGRSCYYEYELAALKKNTEPSIFALYESIYRALDALLRATSTSDVQSAKPKSLLAMCLRKVPDYLAELEAWRLQGLEGKGTASTFDESNTSFDVYSDLEWLGAGNNGWKHLATVVQSHGIRIVKNAISERLLSDEFTILLVDLTSELKPLNDRRQLLEAAVTQQHQPPLYSNDIYHPNAWANAWLKSSTVLQLLTLREDHELRDPSGHLVFKARLTTDLLSKQLIPQEWLLSKMFDSIWRWQMRFLTSRRAFYDSSPFFIASIQLYCNQIRGPGRKAITIDTPATSAQQSLINSLATLSTLVLLGQETLETLSDVPDEIVDANLNDAHEPHRPKPLSWRDQTKQLCNRTEYILRASLAEATDSHGRPSRRCSTYVLLLAVYFIAGESEFREKQMLADVWAAINVNTKHPIHQQYYEATMALMAWISRGCTRRNSAKQAHAYLVKLCDKLEAACPGVQALSTIRVDAAFYLYDLTGDIWDLNFAERLAATAGQQSMTSQQTPRKSSAFGGFRWDEGISEWVTVTPEMQRKRPAALQRATRRSRCESPEIEEMIVGKPEAKPRISDLVSSSSSDSSDNEEDDDAEAGQAGVTEFASSPSPGSSSNDDEEPVSEGLSAQVLKIDFNHLSHFTSSNPYLVGTTPPPKLIGKTCHTKRPRTWSSTSSTQDNARAVRPPGKRARGRSPVTGDDEDEEGDLDELGDQENRPPPRPSSSAKATTAGAGAKVVKKKRSRRSLVGSLKGWDGGGSGDELGM
ncbi:hypothetical protein GE09DRAFT_101782 [Coniochaeta sp. 2T2.1]|nr:hypothetical protein GE09DRAFT_101782 [Coniochaeta sp. 2T2.1]